MKHDMYKQRSRTIIPRNRIYFLILAKLKTDLGSLVEDLSALIFLSVRTTKSCKWWTLNCKSMKRKNYNQYFLNRVMTCIYGL